MNTILGLLCGAACLVVGVLFFLLLYLIRFTNQKFVDSFRLNKILKRTAAKDKPWDEVLSEVCEIAWRRKSNFKQNYTIRNGWIIEEIENPARKEGGYISVLIYRDNRPFEKVCPIMFTTDISGIDMKTSYVAENLKDFENMMALSGYTINETFKILRDIQNKDELAKNAVMDHYISYGLRQIL